MPDKFIKLPDIDYSFWKEKNEFYSSESLSESTKKGLMHASKAGLIGKFNFESNLDLVKFIDAKISEHCKPSDFSDEDLLLIFDLIQGWGGANCRAPYVRPKHSPWRFDPNYSIKYRKSVQMLYELKQDPSNSEVDKISKTICQMNGVMEPFATKHMYFWSKNLSGCRVLLVYDTRMKAIFNASNKLYSSGLDYVSFLNSITDKANEMRLTEVEIEKALFAFSSNYYKNKEKLTLKSEEQIKYQHPKDDLYAKELSKNHY